MTLYSCTHYNNSGRQRVNRCAALLVPEVAWFVRMNVKLKQQNSQDVAQEYEVELKHATTLRVLISIGLSVRLSITLSVRYDTACADSDYSFRS